MSSEADKEAGVPAQGCVRAFAGGRAGAFRSASASLFATLSRGSLRLAGAQPGPPPRPDPNSCTGARDVEVMTAGPRAARAIGRAAALDPQRGEEVLPGAGVRADDSVRNYLHQSLRSHSRQAGTCRIGTDPRAVADTDLRVHGIRGLPVADAAVMPCIVSAGTNATVYGVAERAAALIRPDSPAALRRAARADEHQPPASAS
jgi:choline dehydrogenase